MISKGAHVATIQERIADLKANPKNRSCREVITILEALGARRRKKSGSDHVYSFPRIYPLTLPCHNPGSTLKTYAMRQAIQFMEDILERQGHESSGESGSHEERS